MTITTSSSSSVTITSSTTVSTTRLLLLCVLGALQSHKELRQLADGVDDGAQLLL